MAEAMSSAMIMPPAPPIMAPIPMNSAVSPASRANVRKWLCIEVSESARAVFARGLAVYICGVSDQDQELSGPADADLHANPERELTPAARRALEEAAKRRAEAETASLPPEQGGLKGAEPTRYGDWEKKGVAVDF